MSSLLSQLGLDMSANEAVLKYVEAKEDEENVHAYVNCILLKVIGRREREREKY